MNAITQITHDIENTKPVCRYFLSKVKRFEETLHFQNYVTPFDPNDLNKVQSYINKYDLNLVDSMLDTFFFIDDLNQKYIYSNRNLTTGKTTWSYALFGKFYFVKYEDYDECC
jgi:hypothetical protein